MVSLSTSHAVSRWFVPLPVHTKLHHKNGTNCLPAWHTGLRIGVWQCNPTAKGRVVGRTVFGDIHYKGSTGINHKSRVSYSGVGFLGVVGCPYVVKIVNKQSF